MAAVSEQRGSADRAVLGPHPGLIPQQPGRGGVWPAIDFPLERMEVGLPVYSTTRGAILKILPIHASIRADWKERESKRDSRRDREVRWGGGRKRDRERKERRRRGEKLEHPGLLMVCRLAGDLCQDFLLVPARGQPGTGRDTAWARCWR